MSSQTVVNLVIGLAIAGLLIYRQLQARPVRGNHRMWMRDGQPWVQGSVVTAALWVVALGAHLGYDYLIGTGKDIAGLGSATVVLYLAVTLGVQRFIVSLRAQRLDTAAVRSTAV